MLDKIKLSSILFLDIETVPLQSGYENLEQTDQQLFADKTQYQRRDGATPEEFYERAGIWAEFGKIVCISVGYFVERDSREFRMRTFSGEEDQILADFKSLVERHFSKKHHRFCAHNGKEFDFPYIARRMVIHGIELPEKLVFFNKKPWEINHLDTMQMWKFGDHKHFTSLKLLTRVLGIPSPKGDIDGSQVRDVFYKEKDINRICRYCESDVLALAQVLLRFKNQPLLQDAEVTTTTL